MIFVCATSAILRAATHAVSAMPATVAVLCVAPSLPSRARFARLMPFLHAIMRICAAVAARMRECRVCFRDAALRVAPLFHAKVLFHAQKKITPPPRLTATTFTLIYSRLFYSRH